MVGIKRGQSAMDRDMENELSHGGSMSGEIKMVVAMSLVTHFQ